MKHLFQHLAFLASIIGLVFLFVFASKAQAQGQDLRGFTFSHSEVETGKREGKFYIPKAAIFQHQGQVYVYAGMINSMLKDSTDIICNVSTNSEFETFRMIVQVKKCRMARPTDLVFVKQRKNLLYIPVRKDEQSGYFVLINIKSQEHIDDDFYQDEIERTNDLISKSIYARN